MQDLTIEEEIFGKLTPVKDSFGPFGFTRKASGWVYRESFLNGAFVAEIHIDDRRHLTGRVIDADLEEDYLPFRVKTDVGDYVASVRQGYADILQKVARACYKSAPFASSQANRIASLILSRYHESPDFPFSTYPDCAVFRFDGTGSWYGLVMPVRFSKISGVPKASPEDDPVVDVLNLRVGENRVGEATSHPGFILPTTCRRKPGSRSSLTELRMIKPFSLISTSAGILLLSESLPPVGKRSAVYPVKESALSLISLFRFSQVRPASAYRTAGSSSQNNRLLPYP